MAINLARVGNIPVRQEPDYNPFEEGEARRRALQLRQQGKLDLRKGEQDIEKGVIDLANARRDQGEADRKVGEDASRRKVMGDYINLRETAAGIPIGVRAPELIDLGKAGPLEEGDARVNFPEIERRARLDLARVNPDFSESFRTGMDTERETVAERGRNAAAEGRNVAAEGRNVAAEGRKADEFAWDQKIRPIKERKATADAYAAEQSPLVAWYNAKTGRISAEKPPAGASVKPPTESQSGYAVYGRRMQQALNDMNEIESKGFNRADRGTAAAAKTKNFFGIKTPELQRQEQAERNFVNAALRKESGAVISDQEFKNAERQYFPRAGDSKEVIEQKRRNRAVALQSFRGLSGPAWETAGGDVPPTESFDPNEWEVIP